MNKIRIIPIKKLKVHERINKSNLFKVKKILISAGGFTKPIIVDEKYFIILDGHHRAQALKDFGFSNIPVYLVDYSNKKIIVSSRRKTIEVTKKDVISRALCKNPYPYKTSRHYILHRPVNLNIKLCKLI